MNRKLIDDTMAKRFTDTYKWRQEFFKSLDMAHKLLWLYVLDDLDTAGFWSVDLEIASLRIGAKFEKEKVIETFGNMIKVINNDMWFVPQFLYTQYRNAKGTDSKFHASIQRRLQEHNLTGYTDYDPELPY